MTEASADESVDELMNVKHVNKEKLSKNKGQKRGPRTRKSFSRQTVATIEVFIVADKHMVQFHGNDTIEDYVLTMMNMVGSIYTCVVPFIHVLFLYNSARY